MQSKYLLSTQVSKAQALLLSGSLAFEVEQVFQKWKLNASALPKDQVSKKLIEWNQTLCEVSKNANEFGFSMLPILREVAPVIRMEEKLWARLKNYERQFAAQIALVLVLPWACAVASGPFPWGVLAASGAVAQLMGCGLFYFFVRRALVDKNTEENFLLEFLFQVRLRLLVGQPLHNALEVALQASSARYARCKQLQALFQAWYCWWQGFLSFSDSHAVQWLKYFTKSPEIAATMRELQLRGAPCEEFLRHRVQRILDERLARLDLRMGMLPTFLSMVICVFFAPAFFLILGENLWPQVMSMLVSNP